MILFDNVMSFGNSSLSLEIPLEIIQHISQGMDMDTDCDILNLDVLKSDSEHMIRINVKKELFQKGNN